MATISLLYVVLQLSSNSTLPFSRGFLILCNLSFVYLCLMDTNLSIGRLMALPSAALTHALQVSQTLSLVENPSILHSNWQECITQR